MSTNSPVVRFTFRSDGYISFSGRMVESSNYNRSVAAGALVPSVTLAPVLPKDWNLLETMEGALNGHDNTNVMVWRLGSPDNGQVQTCPSPS